MDLFEAMQTFVRVVDLGSLTGAAERLNLAKSAVSRRLTELEAHLGVQLLQRTTRRISLTDSGAAYLDQARRILGHLEEAEQMVSGTQTEIRGRLRVAVPVSFGTLHLAPLINSFLGLYPKLVCDLDLNDRYLNLVEEGVDLAIRVGRLQDSSLVARRLGPIHFALIASPDYANRVGPLRHPEDLVNCSGLIYSHVPDAAQWRFADHQFQAAPLSVRLRANNGEFLMRAVQAGLGIAVMPTFLCYRELEAGTVVRLLPEYPLEEESLYALYPAKRYLPRRVRVFIDMLAERFGDSPYWDL